MFTKTIIAVTAALVVTTSLVSVADAQRAPRQAVQAVHRCRAELVRNPGGARRRYAPPLNESGGGLRVAMPPPSGQPQRLAASSRFDEQGAESW